MSVVPSRVLDNRYEQATQKPIAPPSKLRIVQVIIMLCRSIDYPNLIDVNENEIDVKNWDKRNCYFNLRGKACRANLHLGHESLFVVKN